jgi:hypothetical protein
MTKKEEKSVFELVEGLTPIAPDKLTELRKAMAEVVPEIEKIVEERRLQAAESRLQLKFWT